MPAAKMETETGKGVADAPMLLELRDIAVAYGPCVPWMAYPWASAAAK